jgi:excisionase family DNA binding protein
MPAEYAAETSGLPALLTYDEASQALRVSRQTLTRMVNEGSIRAIRLRAGGASRISVDDLRSFIQGEHDEREP